VAPVGSYGTTHKRRSLGEDQSKLWWPEDRAPQKGAAMLATRSSLDERGSSGCSEPINWSRGEEGEVARCSVENGRREVE
jgi:hypothetical protein